MYSQQIQCRELKTKYKHFACHAFLKLLMHVKFQNIQIIYFLLLYDALQPAQYTYFIIKQRMLKLNYKKKRYRIENFSVTAF